MPQTLIPRKSGPLRQLERRGDVYWAVVVCVCLAVAVAVVFGQTLRFGFLHYDDNFFVFNEPNISRGFTLSGIVWTFTNGPLGEFYPLSMLSHMLDCQLFGLNPTGHHLTNVLLHATTSMGLFLVLWRMTGQRAVPEVAQVSGGRVAAAGPSATTLQRAVPEAAQVSGGRVAPAGPSAMTLWPSALVAALFAVHPQHVESVAWIAERRDTLSGLLLVLVLGAYDEYVRHPKSWLRYSAVAALLALGLMAKGMLVSVPALLLLLDYWPLRRFETAGSADNRHETTSRRAIRWRLVLEKLPLLAIAVAGAALTWITHSSRPDPLTIPERLANATISYVVYLGQYFVPVGLNIYYSHPDGGWPAWQVAEALLLLLAITTAAVVWRRSLPFFLVGWFWYVGMLVPVLGLTHVGDHARADRYTYLPEIGLSIALVWGAMRVAAGWSARRWVFGIGAAAMIVALVASAWRQTGFWQDDQTVWRRAVACDANNPVAHFTLGDSLDGKDDDAASDQYRAAPNIGPPDWKLYRWTRGKAYNGLGSIAARRQHFDEAIADFRSAIELDPTLSSSYMNLGVQLLQKGDFDEAEVQFQRARELAPNMAAATWANLAQGQMAHQMTDEAIANFHKSLALDDRLVMAQFQLAMLLADRGEVEEAIAHFRRTIQLDPEMALPYYRLAALLRTQGKTDEAAQFDEQGVKASRRYAETQNKLGVELIRQGKLDQAISQFQMAIAVLPDFVAAYQNLGDALAQQGRFDEAKAAYRRALGIDANYEPAKRALERLPQQ